MIDIVLGNSAGLQVQDVQTPRAKNILSVQVGSLEYAPELGIDLRYFLTESVKFETASFKSYLVKTLSNYGINVSSLIEAVNALWTDLTFTIDSEDQTSSTMVAR